MHKIISLTLTTLFLYPFRYISVKSITQPIYFHVYMSNYLPMHLFIFFPRFVFVLVLLVLLLLLSPPSSSPSPFPLPLPFVSLSSLLIFHLLLALFQLGLLITLNLITLNLITLNLITLNLITLNLITLNLITLNLITLNLITLNLITLNFPANLDASARSSSLSYPGHDLCSVFDHTL